MMLWKMWYDLRVRFFICLALVILNILLLIAIYPVAGSFASWVKTDIPKEAWGHLKEVISNYPLFMDYGWFREVKYISGFAILFSLGGVMAERKTRSVYFTLSLPVLRRQWILYQSGMVLALIAFTCAIATAKLLLGGIAYGSAYPFWRAIQGTTFLTLIAFPWIGLTFAIASLTQDRMKTGLILYCAWFFMGALNAFPAVRFWLPRHLMDYYLNGNAFPWQAFLVILSVGIGGLWFAIQRFEKTDY
jgi:hypothetical protein